MCDVYPSFKNLFNQANSRNYIACHCCNYDKKSSVLNAYVQMFNKNEFLGNNLQ